MVWSYRYGSFVFLLRKKSGYVSEMSIDVVPTIGKTIEATEGKDPFAVLFGEKNQPSICIGNANRDC